jgi:hypothetical protein
MREFKVSFFTNCYEADWETLLCKGRLMMMLESLNYPFCFVGLVINNVANKLLVEQYAQQAVKNGIITQYYFADECAAKMLQTFEIKRRSFILDFHDGYWYSLGPLVSIYKCPTEYLLYLTCDCIIDTSCSKPWISEAIEKMRSNGSILTATALWSYDKGEAKMQSVGEDDNWFTGNGFSDQCFLIKNADLFGGRYNDWHLSSESYPIYAGNLFERRVNSFMRKNGLFRLVSKNSFYIHEKIIDSSVLTKTRKSKFRNLISRLSRTLRRNIKKITFLPSGTIFRNNPNV